MDKVKQKLLDDLKRSNKERKLKLAQKYGFNTVEEYLDYLEDKKVKVNPLVSEPTVKPTIHNVVLLDATGSMRGDKYNNSKEGITKELEWLKVQTDVNYTATVHEFIDAEYNNAVNTKIHGTLLNPSDLKLSFIGAVGHNTPLYKSVLETIQLIESKVNPSDKVLLKVYTDGENNSANNYLRKCRDKIKEVQNKNFTVTFVGTKYDLGKIISDLELDRSNCLEIENSGKGFEEAMTRSFEATKVYTASVLKGEDVSIGFYKTIIK